MTCNLNGIRSATRKGFWDWVKRQRAQVLCLQEIRAHEAQIPEEALALKNYHMFWKPAERPGYSGVGIYTREKPKQVITHIGHPVFDKEGRFIQIDLKDLSVISLYMPSGTSGDVRQDIKYECLDFFYDYLKSIRRKRRDFVICGDLNIAHTKMDIKNWRSNQKNSGFLPEERQWMTDVIEDLGFVDAYRHLCPEKEEYTWWSNRGRARENNVGWRIDYHLVTPGLRSKLKSTRIHRSDFFSDHAPQFVDFDI